MYNLYLKEHNVTGLKYLGYTSRQDYDVYSGSGKYWRKHLDKHGYDVTTTLLGSYETEEELKENGIKYSIMWDVVNSNKFANLKTEEGISGKYGEETRKKMSDSAKKRGAPVTAWTSEQASKLNKESWKDPEVRRKRSEGISKSLTGRKNGPRSQEFKDYMKKTLTGRSYGTGVKHNLKEKTCPHCGVKGKGPNMTRYHFDKCKQNLFGDVSTP